MAAKKSATLNLRVDPMLKEALRVAAEKEHRSIANLVEYLVRQHCEKAGVPVPEQASLFEARSDENE